MPDPRDEPNEPSTYTPAPPATNHPQDEDDEEDGLRVATMVAPPKLSPNDYLEALAVAQREGAHPSQDWEGYCQKFFRLDYLIPPLFSSAWTQWLGADVEDRHAGGSPSEAPLGSALCYKGTGPFGHIMLAARDFPSGVPAAWSNDLVVWGEIDKVARTAPTSAWSQGYLGYLTAVNDYDLQLREAKPPKPKQAKRYKAIAKAIEKMEKALETAKIRHDWTDVRVLRDELKRLRRLYAALRHS